MREGNVEGCRDGVESIAYCTVLCSSQHHPEHEHFFNHSTESRAEDACHTTPSAHITAATLRTAPPRFPSPSAPTRLTVPLSCSFFLPHLCSRSLALHLALSPSSALLVCVTVSFACSSSLLLPPPPFPLLALDGLKLFVYYKECCSCLIDQPTGRNLSCSRGWDACFSDCQPCQPVRRARVCVCVCLTHELLSSETGGCCDMSASFVTLGD